MLSAQADDPRSGGVGGEINDDVPLPYQRPEVIPLVDYTAKLLTEILEIP